MKWITAYEWNKKVIEINYKDNTELRDKLIRNIGVNVNGRVLVDDNF